jgi:hypothetical protein
MATLGATLGTRSRKIGSRRGAALALSGFAGLMVGSFVQLADRASDCFCISLRVAMDTLPAISLGAWQIAEPYLLGHLSVLEGLLQISAPCWTIVLTLAGVFWRAQG